MSKRHEGPSSPPSSSPPPIRYQPVFTSDRVVFGYELFFRIDAWSNPGAATPAQPTVSEALIEFVRTDLRRIVGPHRAFINVTQEFIVNGYCARLPADMAILEVLEDVQPEPAVLSELSRLSEMGYQIALDDFVFRNQQIPLVNLAHIVKIDLVATPRKDIPDLLETIRPYNVQFLAEKIETADDLQFSLDLGFDYLQGYYLSRPEPIQLARTASAANRDRTRL